MGTRERLKHVAAGAADSFISRNNDLSGYWAPGLMYRDVETPPHRVKLDLLSGCAEPATPSCSRMARKYARFAQVAAAKILSPHEALTSAVMHLQFNATIPAGQHASGSGDPCAVTVILRSGEKEGSIQRLFRCLPFAEIRFTRATGREEFFGQE